MQRVEDAAPQRHQRDQQKIGKGDPRQRDRQVRICCGSREKPGASSSITCGVKSSASASSTTWVAINSVKMRSPNSARRRPLRPGCECARRPE